MTDVLTQPRPIRLKGRSYLALALAPEVPFQDWLARLDDLASRSAGFFLRRPIVLDVDGLEITREELRALIEQLGTRGVRIMGIEGARHSLLAADLPPAMSEGRPAADFEPPPVPPDADETPAPAAKPVAQASVDAGPPRIAPSLVIKQPVRSGQSVVFPEGDVTVLGSVASGAEVVAGGSIHVYGALRGRALAGTTGNGAARIFCRKLEAELIAIDGFYKTAEDMDQELRGQAAQIWLEDEMIMAEKLG